MRRLFLITCLVAVLLQEAGAIPAPQVSFDRGPMIGKGHTCDSLFQVPNKTKGKHWISEQDTEKYVGRTWGNHTFQHLEKDDQLVDLLHMPKSKPAFIKKPGNSARVETEDMLSRFRRPQQGPEPDLDSLYHPASQEIQVKEEPLLRAMLSRQVLRGPEKDLDHIYHPTGES